VPVGGVGGLEGLGLVGESVEVEQPQPAHYSLFWFMLLSVITRGARFFLLAWLLGRYGIGIRAVLDRHLNVVAGLFAAVRSRGRARTRGRRRR
jgi:hypothetical protein